MAKFVVAGVANCPYYARAELLADKLAYNLPNFNVHKITKLPQDWEDWLTDLCQQKGWQHQKSPIIWREILDRGGKGMLIGGANEFQEYANSYYGALSELKGDDMTKIADENLSTTVEFDELERERRAALKPVRICVTNATSPVSYSFIGSLAKGDALGAETDVALNLFDTDENLSELSGVEMESFDLATRVLRGTKTTSDIREAFADCSIIVLNGDAPDMSEFESRDAWLYELNSRFVNYANVISEVARPDVKVIVAGNGPVNFIASMIARAVPGMNVAATPRLVENHAKAELSSRLKVNSACIVSVLVWGSVNEKHVIDVRKSRIYEYDSAVWGPRPFSVSTCEMVHDDAWLAKDFQRLVEQRNRTLEGSLQRRAAMAAGDALASLLADWWLGSDEKHLHSLAVPSQGWYGIPEGLVFSFPVKFSAPGEYTIVDELELSPEIQTAMSSIIEELECDVEVIYPNPNKPVPPPPVTESSFPPKERVKVVKFDSDSILDDEEAVKTEAEVNGDDVEPGEQILDKISEDQEGEETAAHELQSLHSNQSVHSEQSLHNSDDIYDDDDDA